MKTILLLLVLFFILRFIIRFVWPVVRMARNATRTMRQMQEGMNNQGTSQSQSHPGPGTTYTRPQVPKGDYIDFEEIK